MHGHLAKSSHEICCKHADQRRQKVRKTIQRYSPRRVRNQTMEKNSLVESARATVWLLQQCVVVPIASQIDGTHGASLRKIFIFSASLKRLDMILAFCTLTKSQAAYFVRRRKCVPIRYARYGTRTVTHTSNGDWSDRPSTQVPMVDLHVAM